MNQAGENTHEISPKTLSAIFELNQQTNYPMALKLWKKINEHASHSKIMTGLPTETWLGLLTEFNVIFLHSRGTQPFSSPLNKRELRSESENFFYQYAEFEKVLEQEPNCIPESLHKNFQLLRSMSNFSRKFHEIDMNEYIKNFKETLPEMFQLANLTTLFNEQNLASRALKISKRVLRAMEKDLQKEKNGETTLGPQFYEVLLLSYYNYILAAQSMGDDEYKVEGAIKNFWIVANKHIHRSHIIVSKFEALGLDQHYGQWKKPPQINNTSNSISGFQNSRVFNNEELIRSQTRNNYLDPNTDKMQVPVRRAMSGFRKSPSPNGRSFRIRESSPSPLGTSQVQTIGGTTQNISQVESENSDSENLVLKNSYVIDQSAAGPTLSHWKQMMGILQGNQKELENEKKRSMEFQEKMKDSLEFLVTSIRTLTYQQGILSEKMENIERSIADFRTEVSQNQSTKISSSNEDSSSNNHILSQTNVRRANTNDSTSLIVQLNRIKEVEEESREVTPLPSFEQTIIEKKVPFGVKPIQKLKKKETVLKNLALPLEKIHSSPQGKSDETSQLQIPHTNSIPLTHENSNQKKGEPLTLNLSSMDFPLDNVTIKQIVYLLKSELRQKGEFTIEKTMEREDSVYGISLKVHLSGEKKSELVFQIAGSVFYPASGSKSQPNSDAKGSFAQQEIIKEVMKEEQIVFMYKNVDFLDVVSSNMPILSIKSGMDIIQYLFLPYIDIKPNPQMPGSMMISIMPKPAPLFPEFSTEFMKVKVKVYVTHLRFKVFRVIIVSDEDEILYNVIRADIHLEDLRALETCCKPFNMTNLGGDMLTILENVCHVTTDPTLGAILEKNSKRKENLVLGNDFVSPKSLEMIEAMVRSALKKIECFLEKTIEAEKFYKLDSNSRLAVFVKNLDLKNNHKNDLYCIAYVRELFGEKKVQVVAEQSFFTNKGNIEALAWKNFPYSEIQSIFRVDYSKLRTTEKNFVCDCLIKTIAFQPPAFTSGPGKTKSLKNPECNSWKETSPLALSKYQQSFQVDGEGEFLCIRIVEVKGVPLFLRVESQNKASFPLIFLVESEKWRKVGESYYLTDVLAKGGWNVIAKSVGSASKSGFQRHFDDEVKVHYVENIENFLNFESLIKYNFKKA